LLVLILACFAHTAFASLSDLNEQLLHAAHKGDLNTVDGLLADGADKILETKTDGRRYISLL
jgi:hypothetical protein